MHPTELLDQLLDLARAAGLEVRHVRAGSAEGDVALKSGACRVKDRVWLLLLESDAVEERIAVVSEALSTHARDFLRARYLPPAVRGRLGGDFEGA